MKRSSKVNRATSILVSYLMFITLTLSVSGIIIMQTIFNPAFIIRQAERSHFAQNALAEVQEKFTSHGAASGIPREIMDSVLTQRHVDNAIKTTVRSLFGNGSPYAFDLYEEELIEAFHEYAVSQGISESEEQSMGLTDLATLCADDFKAHVVTPAESVISQAVVRFDRILAIFTYVTAIITILLAVLQKLLNRRISMLMSSYIYTFGATALVCIIIPASVFGSGITKRLGITPQSYNRLISMCCDGIAEAYLIALIPLLLAIAAFTTVWVIRRRQRRRQGLS